MQAKDAERFVRVWVKDGDMLFTGNIRLTDDSRFSLSGKVGTVAVLRSRSLLNSFLPPSTTKLTVYYIFGLVVETNTSLVLQSSGPEDSGDYECRSGQAEC